MHTKRNAIFLIDREKDRPDGKLRYRIKWDGNTVAFNVGFRVEFDKWSNETQRAKNNTTHGKKKTAASVINKEITRFEHVAEAVFSEYEKNDKIPSAAEFRDEFNKRNGKTVVDTDAKGFFQLFDDFTFETGTANQWAAATFQKFSATKKHCKGFAEDMTFEMLDENTLQAFVIYLRDKQDMRNSTISKQLDLLKWFLRWATTKGFNKNNAYTSFAPKFKTADKKVIFLEWEELMTVCDFVTPPNGEVVELVDGDGKAYKKTVQNAGTLQLVRDVFCFCCFTSLRYSDVANLKRSDVFADYISITTVKTADSLKIELNDYSRAILEKYRGETFVGNLALPVISNQKMNDYLKELGELCGINKPVTITYYKGNQRIDEVYPKYALLGTHCGRRTFICNALMLGVPAQVVMKWTGHSDYKTMRPYIDVADTTKAEAMQVFNKKSPK